MELPLRKHWKPKKAIRMALFPAMTALFFLGTLFSQSVVDLARQERARKAQEGKAGKVFTNDDFPAPSPSTAPAAAPKEAPPSGPATAAGAQDKKPEGEKTTAAGKEEAKPAEQPEKTQADLEKEYRGKFAKLRDQLDYETRKLDVMQRELNLMLTQYYSDPNVALREQTYRDEINKRNQDIDQQKAAVDKAKQAIADLEEELQKKGLPPGWARESAGS